MVMLKSGSIGVVTPQSYRFDEPLAPAVAAERAGTVIRMAAIMKVFTRLSAMHDYLIVEGAGGIMVPLTGNHLFLDLAAKLGLPALIVARVRTILRNVTLSGPDQTAMEITPAATFAVPVMLVAVGVFEAATIRSPDKFTVEF